MPHDLFMREQIDALLKEIVARVLSRKEAEKILLFGSRARGDATPSSDIDIAILDSRWTREDINALRDELEEQVHTALKIDLLGFDLLEKDTLKRRILAECVVVHER